MKIPLNIIVSFCLLAFIRESAYGQNVISGQVNDIASSPVFGARVTLFNISQSYFQEARTNSNGIYMFSNVPAGDYFLGVAKINKEYVEESISVLTDLLKDFTLEAESNPGDWPRTLTGNPWRGACEAVPPRARGADAGREGP